MAKDHVPSPAAIEVLEMYRQLSDHNKVLFLQDQVGELVAQLETCHRQHGPIAPERLCACGCGQIITSPRPEAKYATGACRVRAHRAS